MSEKTSNKLETWGNEKTMNLNLILHQNILNSGYFKQLYEKKTYHQIIDEIYYHGPFLKGTVASSCFCLLYKLWTIRLTVKQIYGLLDHTDSPHIRAVGLLYLRYVCKPADLWSWFEPYLDDPEEIQVTGGANPRYSTIGEVGRDLLTVEKWEGTQLPRIPVPIARDIEAKLQERYPQRSGRGGRGGRGGGGGYRGGSRNSNEGYGDRRGGRGSGGGGGYGGYGSKPYDRPYSSKSSSGPGSYGKGGRGGSGSYKGGREW
ncbi:PRP38 family-domain-containing protein [Paraphysoderma sedebokerense]|nr:PRP38 family-domain-containing protein [Paraphysoderma sedebokerense]